MTSENVKLTLQKHKVLLVFQRIREMLIDAGVDLLTGDWDIREQSEPGFLGFCHTEHQDWDLIDENLRVAKRSTMLFVGIRLVPEGQDRIYPLASLVLTLLHEFAHVIAPLVQTKHKVDKGGKKTRKWQFDEHGKEFYQAFAEILQIAERLEIFQLPNQPNKFHRKYLSRFDRIDLDSCLLPQSCIPDRLRRIYEESLEADAPASTSQVTSLRLTISAMVRGKKRTKSILVDPAMTSSELFCLAKEKLGMVKIPKVMRTQDGSILSNMDCSQFENDQLVWF